MRVKSCSAVLHSFKPTIVVLLYSRRRESREYSDHPRLCVCYSLCLSVYDKTNTTETRIVIVIVIVIINLYSAQSRSR